MSSLDSAKDAAHGQGTAAAPARQVNQFKTGGFGPKPTGIGLPCANCKTYFAADLPACPVCKGKQRVSPVEPLTTVTPAEQLPDPKQLEEERERFLRDFNSQVVANSLPPDSPTPAMHCELREKHPNSQAAANICQSCYDELQERVDVLEAAMHMDIREASQIIYDAVWADTSDPSKTYQNAAQALLIELRRRSAITQVFGQLQPPIN
jgi:hypothetical protein